MRLEANITEKADVYQVQWLQAVLEAGNSELLKNALAVFAWAVVQTMDGRRLASVDASGEEIREFSTPLLERAKWTSITMRDMPPESIEKIAQLIASPPEPTSSLKKLFVTDAAAAGV